MTSGGGGVGGSLLWCPASMEVFLDLENDKSSFALMSYKIIELKEPYPSRQALSKNDYIQQLNQTHQTDISQK